MCSIQTSLTLRMIKSASTSDPVNTNAQLFTTGTSVTLFMVQVCKCLQQVPSAQMAHIAFGSFSPGSPDLIAAPRSSQPFAMPGLRRQVSEPSMHSMHAQRSGPNAPSPTAPTFHHPLDPLPSGGMGLVGGGPSPGHMRAEYHWSPFVGHMPMTPGTFNAIQRGEFCAPGWSQGYSPTGFRVPPTPPTTPCSPGSAGRTWKAMRPHLDVQVPSSSPWHEHSSPVSLTERCG